MQKIFQKSRSHLKILGARRVKWSKFHTEKPQILGVTVQNLSRHGDLAPGTCAVLPRTMPKCSIAPPPPNTNDEDVPCQEVHTKFEEDRQCTYKRNIQGRSRNHCYRGKAISIKYSVCVFVCVRVCSLTYPARNAHAPYYIVICGLSVSTIFFHIIS
jgi:hypothetical protein